MGQKKILLNNFESISLIYLPYISYKLIYSDPLSLPWKFQIMLKYLSQ